MAIREITFTVTVRYNDTKIVNPGHLVGGMTDEIQGWGGSGEHYEVKVSEATHETPVDYARREAIKLIVHSLDHAEGKTQDTTRAYGDTVTAMVQAAMQRYCDLTGEELFPTYLKLQGEALLQRTEIR